METQREGFPERCWSQLPVGLSKRCRVSVVSHILFRVSATTKKLPHTNAAVSRQFLYSFTTSFMLKLIRPILSLPRHTTLTI